jgi:hypothetical protein
VFRDEAELEKLWRPGRRYEPSMTAAERGRHLAQPRRGIRRVVG